MKKIKDILFTFLFLWVMPLTLFAQGAPTGFVRVTTTQNEGEVFIDFDDGTESESGYRVERKKNDYRSTFTVIEGKDPVLPLFIRK